MKKWLKESLEESKQNREESRIIRDTISYWLWEGRMAANRESCTELEKVLDTLAKKQAEAEECEIDAVRRKDEKATAFFCGMSKAYCNTICLLIGESEAEEECGG